MAVGKNKRLVKGGKKGGKKKIVDPFTKKDWYNLRAPTVFTVRDLGTTMVNRSAGKVLASDGLKGRVFEVSLADLQNDEIAFRKIKLIAEEVKDKEVLLNFHGMSITVDKLRSIVKKWQTMIEATVDVKTTDGYYLRVHCIGFTKRRNNQIKKTSYAQKAQVREIREKMTEIINEHVSSRTLKDVVKLLIPDMMATEVEKATQSIYPLHEVHVAKVKILRKPTFELAKLMELHDGGAGGESRNEPPVKDSV